MMPRAWATTMLEIARPEYVDSTVQVQAVSAGTSGCCVTDFSGYSEVVIGRDCGFLSTASDLSVIITLSILRLLMTQHGVFRRVIVSSGRVLGVLNGVIQCPSPCKKDLAFLTKNSVTDYKLGWSDSLHSKCQTLLYESGVRIWENWTLAERLSLKQLELKLGMSTLSAMCGRELRDVFELTREETTILDATFATDSSRSYVCDETLLRSNAIFTEAARTSNRAGKAA